LRIALEHVSETFNSFTQWDYLAVSLIHDCNFFYHYNYAQLASGTQLL